MDEETLAEAELESLQRMAAQSKIGAVMNSPEYPESLSDSAAAMLK